VFIVVAGPRGGKERSPRFSLIPQDYSKIKRTKIINNMKLKDNKHANPCRDVHAAEKKEPAYIESNFFLFRISRKRPRYKIK